MEKWRGCVFVSVWGSGGHDRRTGGPERDEGGLVVTVFFEVVL